MGFCGQELIFFILALPVFFETAQSQREKCFVPIDLVFALDASGSVEAAGFEQIIKFTKELVNGFQFGIKDTHVGVLTFSEIGEVQIGLTDTFNKEELFDKISNLKYAGYRTNTNDALEVVGRDMFSLSGGTRQGVSKILILLTDGKCTLCGNKGVATSANKLKDEGVTIFTIGITDDINREELGEISSDPSENHMFFVKTFSELKTSIRGLQQKSCTVKKGKCMKPPRNTRCSSRAEMAPCQTDDECQSIQKCCFDGCVRTCRYPLVHCLTSIDVAFAIDSSSSVRREGFKRMKDFAGRIAESFAVSQTEARFATLTYSREAEVQFKFERYNNADEVIYAIEQLPHYRSDTRIDKALEVAKSDLFSLNGKVRTRRPMVLIVFYDGDATKNMPDLEEIARPLKNYGVKIVAIGVGPELNIYQIEKIASSSDMIYNGNNFTTLMPKLFNIAKETCNKKFGECSPDPSPIRKDLCRGVESDCENDFDCFGNSKCCRRGCKNTCVRPPNVCLRKMDISFAIHNDMEREEFDTVKYYLKNVVDQFDVGEEKTHISLLRFGPDATVAFDFNSDQSSNEAVKRRIDNLRYERGRAPLSSVLVKACDAIFCQDGGTRMEYHKMMIIVTGPLPAPDEKVLGEKVRILRRRGVNVLVIGVGNVNTDILQRITSDERSTVNRVLLAKDYAGIVQYVRDIPDFGCSEEATSPSEMRSDEKSCKPKTCVKGEKGTRGRTGDVGKQGFDGDRGPPGPKGLQGPKGEFGADGPMGVKGIRGDDGMVGLPGFTGYNGIPGVPGEIGPTGLDGDCGLPGKSGDAGDPGLGGFSGQPGMRGQDGYKGYKGLPAIIDPNMKVYPGDKGDQGEPAKKGRKGQKGEEGRLEFDGDLGLPGAKGAGGNQGDMGDYGTFMTQIGEKGAMGEQGKKGEPSSLYQDVRGQGFRGKKGARGVKGDVGSLGRRGIASTDSGRKGQKGYQGQQGYQGYGGAAGTKGIAGLTGQKGKPGDKGIRGIEGTPGSAGPNGDKGEQGTDGQKGAKGYFGDEAPPVLGSKGSKGESGEGGFPGREGPPGERGPKGRKGDEGELLIGAAGDPGSIGRRGYPGNDGLPGIVGMEGLRGRKGDRGTTGARGDQGKHGTGGGGGQGRDGPPGSKGESGPIGNTGPMGVKGDPVVVDCKEGKCPKGEKGLVGAPGNTGDPGVAGEVGSAGPKGNPGGPCPFCPPGAQGISGNEGNPGTIGDNGQKGNQGDVGDVGTKGVQGSTGPPGFNGDKGPKGTQGDEGSIGISGEDSRGDSVAPKGYKGARGDDGSIGLRGPKGSKGRKGIRGPAGPQGSRGLRGIKGESGLIGIKGFDGQTGRPGKTGDVGEEGPGFPGTGGNIGRQGIQGQIGPKGPVGKKGEPGSEPTSAQFREIQARMDDYVGKPGIRGEVGGNGIKGERGPPGATGANGETGPKGLKGFGGPEGQVGVRGRAGDDGDPGSPGFPGRNGQRGRPGENGKVGKRGMAPKGQKGEIGLPGIDGRPGKDATATLGCVDFGDPTDIAFIVDSSRSVTGEDFERQKEFIKNFLKRFPIGAEQTQAGIIKYGKTADIEIEFNDYTTERELGTAISNIQHSLATESRLDLAFRVARDQLFTAERGSRGQRANKALVLLGDGFISGGGERSITLQQNALQYAEDLKLEGVTIFALGVGAERNKFLLQEIVSDASYYLEIESYSDLLTRIYEVQNDLQDTCTYVGEPGRDGLPGQPGADGDPGQKGVDGSRPAGPTGSKGFKGIKGDVGVGLPGDPGVKGIIGLLGDRGRAGLPGRDRFGERGSKGEKGDRADTIVGPKGKPGEQGRDGPPGPKTQSLCDNVLATDIIFVMDTSSSVGHDNFHKMKEFISNIVQNFDVDNQLTRVSIITYDERADLQIPLSRHNSLNTLLPNIERLRYGNGQATRTDLALALAMNKGFSEINGARNGYNKALVFMTDGQMSYHRDQKSIKEAVQPLKDAGVHTYAIGIGREISATELTTIASGNVVYAESFDQLTLKINDQIEVIARRGCQGSIGESGNKGAHGRNGTDGRIGEPGYQGQRGERGLEGLKGRKGATGDASGRGNKGEKGAVGDPGPQGLPGCRSSGDQDDIVSDIVFMIDASGSLFPDGFQREKDFVKNVIDKMGEVSYLGTHVGVIVYSDEANIRIGLGDHYNNNDMKNAIDNIPYDAKGTRIDLGFKEAKRIFDEDAEHGGRGSSKKVLILLTDGQQTYVPRIREPSVVAKELIADGVDIFAVGIGSEIDRIELESFISKPEFLFLAPEMDKIVAAVSGEITTALTCEGGPRGLKGRPGDDGPPGGVGVTGKSGPSGPKGEAGDVGFGPTGELGEPGVKGILGIKGEQGFRGPEGPPGERGLRGLKGFPGFFGKKGDAGRGGFIGNPGPSGITGDDGERGESIGPGMTGNRGLLGDPGSRGPPGERGALPLGNVIEDYAGPKGEMGPRGHPGREGPPGSLLVAPGPEGANGQTGDDGDIGEFGVRGGQGSIGPDGLKGKRGDAGPLGDAGTPGLPGKRGDAGAKGDKGSIGRSRPGERGIPGPAGVKGLPGGFGIKGFDGFIGMPGKRGDIGDKGFRGLTPKPPFGVNPPRGAKGEKGFKGERGQNGLKGFPAKPIGGDDIKDGAKGDKGVRGLIGERGNKGFPGIGRPGVDGIKGFPGPPGFRGTSGTVGPRGRPGRAGQIIGGSQPGDVGSLGFTGETGEKGRQGVSGMKGNRGLRGRPGIQGSRGTNGFTGLRGDQGPLGRSGPKGGLGPKGRPGGAGQPGPEGPSGIAEGFYIVIHSQSLFVPTCPDTYSKMWEGYSLMYTVGNGKSHAQDLGDAGSCAKSFSTMPFLFCDIYKSCKYASRNDFVYWLSGDVTQPMMPVSNTAIEPFISRCVVCEAPSIHVAVHSQSTSRPDCPRGWDPLWRGYSFMMVAGAGKTGAGQSLSSSGSCLKEFRPKPFIECQGARGTCHFFSDKFSFWLTTIDRNNMFTTQDPQTLIKNKGHDLKSRVSRCRVCIRNKGSSISGGDPPEVQNKDNTFIQRFRKSINIFFGE